LDVSAEDAFAEHAFRVILEKGFERSSLTKIDILVKRIERLA
jgi:hypothetical protein